MQEKSSAKPKIVFLVPGIRFSPFGMLNSLPAGPLMLGTILKNLGYGVRLFSEGRASFADKLGRITSPEVAAADIACISIITPNANRGYLLADRLRDMGKKVVIGGMHASIMPGEALSHADAVVTGEAENVIGDIEGLTGIVESGVVENMDDLPVPDLSLDAGRKSPADRLYGPSIPVSTFRGCPYDCDFCSVSSVYGRRARRMSPERVADEIEQRMMDSARRGRLRLFCCDDTYSVMKDERGRQHEKIKNLEKKHGVRVSMCVQDRADRLEGDEDYVKGMSGLVGRVMLGIEQMDDGFLKSHNKGMEVSQIKKTVVLLRKNGIGIHAFCMVSPDTGDDAVKNTISYLVSSGIETAQFTILTPFPGTALYERTRDMLVKGWDNYHTLASVFTQKQGELLEKARKMHLAFYSPGKIFRHALRMEFSSCLSAVYGMYIGHKIFRAI